MAAEETVDEARRRDKIDLGGDVNPIIFVDVEVMAELAGGGLALARRGGGKLEGLEDEEREARGSVDFIWSEKAST